MCILSTCFVMFPGRTILSVVTKNGRENDL